MAREPGESRPLRTRSGRGRVCSAAKAKQPRVSVNKSEQTPGDLLSFASGYFSESNLFNWLQAIQRKRDPFHCAPSLKPQTESPRLLLGKQQPSRVNLKHIAGIFVFRNRMSRSQRCLLARFR